MEFACGFVYAAPSSNKKEGQRPNANAIKRSALLPPVNRVPRPRTPPPPPPTELKHPQATSSGQRTAELVTKVEGVRTPPNPKCPFYENAAFLLQGGAGVPGTPRPHISSPARRTALLPPTMRPSPANTQSQPSYIQPITTPPSTSSLNGLTYEEEPDLGVQPRDPTYAYNLPEGRRSPASGHNQSAQKSVPPSPPSLPPRPSFMNPVPEYLVVLPRPTSSSSSSSSSSSRKSPQTPPLDPPSTAKDKQPLPGNPNVMLVSLGTLLSEENVLAIQGEPTSCSQCGSVLDSCYDNVVNMCYFCQSWEPAPSGPASPQRRCPQMGCHDSLFLLSPEDCPPGSPADALLLFCVDISGSMSITSQVFDGQQTIYKSRLQFVKESVLQCVENLSESQPSTRVGLITFNNQVTLHGYEEFTSRFLAGAELVDSDYLREVALGFPSPPPLCRTSACLKRELLGLEESGATALGPASLLAIMMASRQPGSKVIICTDGKANTELGNLETEDVNARTLLSSTIFYKDLGEYAASQGVTMSVLSIEGTDCRLDELGRLADRTGGKVVIASPHKLHSEFEEIIENRTIATHCCVTLLLPKALCVRGERQAGHCGTREVGNVASNAEITFQFGVGEAEPDGLTSGVRVSVQLQLRYRRRDGQRVLRVLTADRDVTDDSVAVLSSLSLAIIQLNSSQASAALAVRGRFLDAQREGETQRELIERALEHNRSAQDKEIYDEWRKTMDPIHNSMHHYTRRKSVLSDSQSLTDTGAALLYSMKNSGRKSSSLKETSKP